jgi:diguanylate cyclase (GGDEF)-like protein
MLPHTLIADANFSTHQIKPFARNLALIQWMLIALVILYVELPGSSFENVLSVIAASVLYSFNIIFFNYFGLHKVQSKNKIIVETWAMIAYTTFVLWNTGKIESPMLCLYILAIITTASTFDKNINLLEMGLISACVLFLTFSPSVLAKLTLTQAIRYLLMLFPFWLIAYFAKMLSDEIRHGQKLLEQYAMIDELTGLCNLRAFNRFAENELQRSKRYNRTLAVVMCDIDNLKAINDTYGHDAGNTVIKQVVKTIQARLRPIDIVGRFGGDEFILLLPEQGVEGALTVAKRLNELIKDKGVVLANKEINLTLSMGIAIYPHHGSDLAGLIKKADEAMYACKKSNGKKVLVSVNETSVPLAELSAQ